MLNANQNWRFRQNKSVISEDRKSLPGLTGILNPDVLAELTSKDPTLKLMRRTVDAVDYEGFCRIDRHIKTFWNLYRGRMYRDRQPNRNSTMSPTSCFGQMSQSSPWPRAHDRCRPIHLLTQNSQGHYEHLQRLYPIHLKPSDLLP